jgi:hypothetical protein
MPHGRKSGRTARIRLANVQLLVTIAGALVSTESPAATITATARIFCPANVVPGTGHIDTTFARPITNVPCAGIRVVAMDADPLGDEFCGAAYTDSGGNVVIQGECGDGVDAAPEVYVKVEAHSDNGFSVGVVDVDVVEDILEEILKASTGVPPPLTRVVDLFDDLRDHQTFEWVSEVVADGAFGDRFIGAGGPVSFMAARQFWVAQFTMNRLLAGTRFRPMDFNYSLNAPIGFPTTLYDTVIVDSTRNTGAQATRALLATAHEIGHVLYNTYHSDLDHWLLDAPDYMTDHRRCDTDHFQTLAWYEGFADFIRDYVLQRWDWNRWAWALTFRPFPGCAFNTNAAGAFVGPRSMSVEGNVEGLLNDVFFGPVRPALDAAIRVPTTFTCPAGQTLIESSPGVSPECESETTVTCGDGTLEVDQQGFNDRCRTTVTPPCPDRTPDCSPEPVDRLVDTRCPGGFAARRAGPDGCVMRVPAQAVPGGPPIIPLFTCRPGQSLVLPARPAPFGGAAQCESTVPIGCAVGTLEIDGNGSTDQCRTVVDPRCPPTDPRCQPEPVVEQVSPAGCSTGRATRRAGRDGCIVRVPAIDDSRPNGNPRQRPDGSPDAALGLDGNGAPAWFGLPSLDDVMGWVSAAGTRAHRANEFWPDWIRPWCRQRDGLRDRYCHPDLNRSPSFWGERNRLDPALN